MQLCKIQEVLHVLKLSEEERRSRRNVRLALWREKNREKIREQQNRYYQTNKAVCDERVKVSVLKNRPYYSAKSLEWHRLNLDRALRLRRERYATNPGKEILRVRLRQKRIQSLMLWVTQADTAEIEGLYKFCNIFKGFEVDHIIPLNGKQVSGLHVPSNLQILTVHANRSKGALFKE